MSDETTEQRRELEEAGWEMVELAEPGELLWRNPESGHLYPQSAAIDLIRRRHLPDSESFAGGRGGGDLS